MEQVLFWLYGLTACAGALGVVLSQNVVRMAFYLIVALGSTAGLFFLLGADFIGATQLLIYVGGTVVLLIFGVMLTSSAPFQAITNTPAEILQGAFVGLAFLGVVMGTVLSVNWPQSQALLLGGTSVAQGHAESGGPELPVQTGFNPDGEGNTARPIGIALLGARFDRDLRLAGAGSGNLQEASTKKSQSLGAGYLLPFEIVSVHLLVVLVGAAYLARAKRRTSPSEA